MVKKKLIPDGYKQTELGIIPEDWNVVELKKVCDLIQDGTHQTPIYVNDGVPFYSVENVTNNDFKNVKYITLDEYQRISTRCKPAKNDILLTRIGDLGTTTLITWDFLGSIYVSLALLRINQKYDIHYVYNFTKCQKWKQLIKDNSLLHAIPPKINLGEISKVKIPIPQDDNEQKAIAEILSDTDALITALNELIEKKKLIKKGVMQELLTGKRRLKGFTDEWFTTTLGKIAEIYQPKTISQQQLTNGLYPVYGANGLIGHYDTYNHETWQSYITCRGSTCGEITKTTNYCWITGNAMVVNVDNSSAVDKDFFYYNLLSQNFSSCITGSGQPQIVRQPIYDFKIILPNNIAEQQAIARILSDLDKEIEKLELKRDKYEHIKQGMMQKLLTGQIRLVQKAESKSVIKASKEFQEAILISKLTQEFGNEKYPLSRFRYTKFSYFIHRHRNDSIDEYLQKAAGPYNPNTRYKGPENIIIQNQYAKELSNGKWEGFVPSSKITKALDFFSKYYDENDFIWLVQNFKFRTHDELELFSTVDYAMLEIKALHKRIDPESVSDYIESIEEWKDKLKREIFSEVNIKKAIQTCYELFDY